MVKHPLQNLETSLAPQPSGSKSVRRTQGYVQKAQFNVTHKHTADGIIAAGMHMDVASFLGHSGQPAKERSHLMYYKAQQGEC